MIAETLAAVCADRDVLARIGGPLGETARARLGELARDADPRALRARWAASARHPVPPGLRGVHPTWIEAALAALPARARTDLAEGGADPAGVWLARWACADLPPLPAADRAAAPPSSLDDAVRLTGDALARWLTAAGADQLALALTAAGGDALHAAARVLGDPLLLAAKRIGLPPRAGALGPPRAAIARCHVPLDDPHALLVIGARSLAPHVHALARRQLAVRLPRPLGLRVLDELARHARDPLADAPTWRSFSPL